MKMTKQEWEDFNKGLKAAVAKKPPVRKSRGTTDIEVKDIEAPISISKYLKGAVTGDWRGAEIEKKEHKKALGQDIDTAGGFLVPTQISNELIELLKASTVVRSMPGVQTIEMDRDKMTISRVDTPPQVSWGGESTSIAEDTNLSFGEVSLELNKCVCLYKMSNELLMNANQSVDDLVKREMVDAIAIEEDKVFLEGQGGSQPLGFYYHPKVQSTDLSAAIDFDNILDGEYQIESQNAMLTGWVANPRVKNNLRQLKDGNGNYIYQDRMGQVTDAGNANMGDLYGKVAKFTTTIPTTLRPAASETYMVGGAWNNLIIGQKPQIRIETTNTGGDSFQYDQVWIRVVSYVDMALRHPETFTVIKGIQ